MELDDPISAQEGFAQTLAREAVALKADLQKDPQWCERTRARLLAVWGGEISPNEFLDQFVQTLIFTVFLAKNSQQQEISLKNLQELIPPSISVLSELVHSLSLRAEADSGINLAFSRLVHIIATQVHMSNTLSESLSSIYLYEQFLGAFSTKTRRERGVYYTPHEIVEFIVKSVQETLQNDLRISGFCDSHVQLLDFSVGTGAFLIGAIKQTLKEISPELDLHAIIRDKIIPHFSGLEPYLAPNIIAQLNILKILQSPPINYVPSSHEHIHLYPHNTLADPEKDEIFGIELPNTKIVSVVIGNPPYSADSRNNNPWIMDLLQTYKEGLVEKNLKPLNDDYVKFLRYAQWRVEAAGQGIIGIITNNSFLDGLVHRMMRANLLRSFNRLYLLNLHGHHREDGDESVFGIQKVGVVICLFVKTAVKTAKKEVFYFSSLEHNLNSRAEKLDFLSTHRLEDIPWTSLKVDEPNFWFKPRSSQEEETYLAGWGLDEIFEVYTSGIETGNDNFYLAFPAEKHTLAARVQDVLLSQDEGAMKKKYHWLETTNRTIQKLRVHGHPDQVHEAIRPLLYRPMDIRWCYYERGAMSRDRYEVMQNLLAGEKYDLALISVRQVGGQDSFTHVLVTNMIIDNRIMKSTKGKAYLFPLFLARGSSRVPNFQAKFLDSMKKQYGRVPDPRQLFAYIYAVLNSPKYQQQHAFQLRKNFPRMPFVKELSLFEAIATQGKMLIECHLVPTMDGIIPGSSQQTQNSGIIVTRHLRYDQTTQRVYINETQFCEGISPEIWNIKIGGWPVLSHWLSERDGHIFGVEEQQMFERVCHALNSAQIYLKTIDALLPPTT